MAGTNVELPFTTPAGFTQRQVISYGGDVLHRPVQIPRDIDVTNHFP
jgi:hypothetical protein